MLNVNNNLKHNQLNCLTTKLNIIGIDAQLDGLQNIDCVESKLYQGKVANQLDPSSSDSLLANYDYSSLCKHSATKVVQANKLSSTEVAIVQVSDSAQSIQGAEGHISYDTVANLGDALTLCEKIINGSDVAVLLVAANLQNNLQKEASPQQEFATISFAQDFNGYQQLNGVACLLLCSEQFAEKHNSVVYAAINNVVSTNNINQIDDVINCAFSTSNLDKTQISSVEVSAHADIELKQLESDSLLKSYHCGATLNTAITCHKSVLGESDVSKNNVTGNGQLSQLLGLINSVFVLQQRYCAAIKDWTRPTSEQLSAWEQSPFYLLNQAAPVFPNADGKPRFSVYSCLSADNYSHMILQENQDLAVHQNGFNACADLSLFIINADNEKTLLSQLMRLRDSMLREPLTQTDFKAVAQQLFTNYSTQTKQYKIILLAESVAELTKEITSALTGIVNAFKKQSDWKTPKGSYFTANPAENSKVAYLYPGIGATYVGLGRDLFHLFPEIYPNVLALADNIGSSLKNEMMNPRSIVALDFKQLKQLDSELRNDLANIAECGVGFACVFTKIFRDVFAVPADFAGGYSMGEISMYAALGCWQKPGLMSARLANSDTFNHRLSGELRSVRELWDLPDVDDGTIEQIWEIYSIKGSYEQVSQAIESNDRVYITIVNTPDSLTIGGYPEDCLRVIKRLGVRAMPLNMPNAIHSEPSYTEYQDMLDLYSMDVTQRINTKIFSTSCYLPIPQHRKAIAVSIAKCLCDPVDFPRLVNTLAKKEANVFIEMGAGRSLCSWTDKTLKMTAQAENNCEINHLSVPVNAKGTDDQLTYARAVAKLVSFGVEINLHSFFHGSIIQPVPSVK